MRNTIRICLLIFAMLIFITEVFASNLSTFKDEEIIKKNYEFILFYSASCPYCNKFEPILKQYSDATGILVRGFVVGGEFSAYFPNSIKVNQKTIEQFFGKGASISLPTLFILNKNNLHVYAVSSGALTYYELYMRMQQLIPKILKYERGKKDV